MKILRRINLAVDGVWKLLPTSYLNGDDLDTLEQAKNVVMKSKGTVEDYAGKKHEVAIYLDKFNAKKDTGFVEEPFPPGAT